MTAQLTQDRAIWCQAPETEVIIITCHETARSAHIDVIHVSIQMKSNSEAKLCSFVAYQISFAMVNGWKSYLRVKEATYT